MKQLALMLGLTCFAFASNGFANGNTYIAKSTKTGDTCYMTAKVMTLTDSTGKATQGISFKAFSPDGDRLDVHCNNVVIKLKHNNEAFISNLTAEDLTLCQFNEHGPEAGADAEENLIASGQFTLIASNPAPHR